MCFNRSLSASLMKGIFSLSFSIFQRFPKRLEISALCMSGDCSMIFLRSILDHTINAFIGRFMCPVAVLHQSGFIETMNSLSSESVASLHMLSVSLLSVCCTMVPLPSVVSPNYHPRASALCASEVHPLFPELQAAFLTTSWLFHVHDIMGSAPITSSPLRPREPMQRALTLNALPSGPTLRETRISLDKPNGECECQHVNKRNQTNRSHQMFQNPL